MKVRLLAWITAMAVLLSATGCIRFRMPRKIQVQTFHNGYMGLTVTIQNNWVIETRNRRNMTVDAGDSSRWDSLEREEYGDGAAYIELIEFSNSQDVETAENVRVELFAEDYAVWYPTLDAYVQACISSYEGPVDYDYTAIFVGMDENQLNGRSFVRLLYEARQTGGPSYYMEYNIRQVGGLYLTVYADYWEDLPGGEDTARQMMEGAIALDPDKSRDPELPYLPDDRYGWGYGQDPNYPDEWDDWDGDWSEPVEFDQLYNGYLGLRVNGDSETAACHYYNPRNLTQDPEDSRTLQQMEGFETGAGGVYYYLASFDNQLAYDDPAYVLLDLFAEQYEERVDLETYLAYFLAGYGTGWDDSAGQTEEYQVERSVEELGGVLYTRLLLAAKDQTLVNVFYIQAVEDCYFVAQFFYDAADSKANADVVAIKNECFEFTQPDLQRI